MGLIEALKKSLLQKVFYEHPDGLFKRDCEAGNSPGLQLKGTIPKGLKWALETVPASFAPIAGPDACQLLHLGCQGGHQHNPAEDAQRPLETKRQPDLIMVRCVLSKLDASRLDVVMCA
eukprot:scaffold33595_cov17-Prasinocladus_malaysianus.AAC.1